MSASRAGRGGENGTGSSLADARNKSVVQEDTRKQVGIRYSLCRSKSSKEHMLSVSKRDVKQSFFIFIKTGLFGHQASLLT